MLWFAAVHLTIIDGVVQKRYIVLQSGKLAYYKNEAVFVEGGAPMKNRFFPMSAYQVVDSDPSSTVFHLALAAGASVSAGTVVRPFSFRSKSVAKKREWLKHLRAVVPEESARGTKPTSQRTMPSAAAGNTSATTRRKRIRKRAPQAWYR